MKKMAEGLQKIPQIQEIHTCSGDWGYFLKIRVSTLDEYNEIVNKKIIELGGLEPESFVVYKTYKEEHSLLL